MTVTIRPILAEPSYACATLKPALKSFCTLASSKLAPRKQVRWADKLPQPRPLATYSTGPEPQRRKYWYESQPLAPSKSSTSHKQHHRQQQQHHLKVEENSQLPPSPGSIFQFGKSYIPLPGAPRIPLRELPNIIVRQESNESLQNCSSSLWSEKQWRSMVSGELQDKLLQVARGALM